MKTCKKKIVKLHVFVYIYIYMQGHKLQGHKLQPTPRWKQEMDPNKPNTMNL